MKEKNKELLWLDYYIINLNLLFWMNVVPELVVKWKSYFILELNRKKLVYLQLLIELVYLNIMINNLK